MVLFEEICLGGVVEVGVGECDPGRDMMKYMQV